MKKLLAVCALFLSSLVAHAATVTLAWTASPDPNVTGYKVYQGPSSRNYTNITSIPKVTSTQLNNLVVGGTYYFALTAFTSAGLESPYSNEVQYTVPSTPPVFTTQPVSSTNNYGSSVTLTAVATGAVSYQWLFNSVAIAGATTTSLALNNLSWTNNGNYALSAANPSGTVLSSAAKISVNPPVVQNLSVTGP